jgi:hypothetical protein
MHTVPFKDLVAPFGCPQAYYFNSVRFSNAIEEHGVVPTAIECLPDGLRGSGSRCVLAPTSSRSCWTTPASSSCWIGCIKPR